MSYLTQTPVFFSSASQLPSLLFFENLSPCSPWSISLHFASSHCPSSISFTSQRCFLGGLPNGFGMIKDCSTRAWILRHSSTDFSKVLRKMNESVFPRLPLGTNRCFNVNMWTCFLGWSLWPRIGVFLSIPTTSHSSSFRQRQLLPQLQNWSLLPVSIFQFYSPEIIYLNVDLTPSAPISFKSLRWVPVA